MSSTIRVSNISHGNPGVSGWYAILPEPERPCILEEDITADWLIISAGFAGLSAARRLSQLREKESIVLLYSIRIGEGSSDRNSGFMIDLPHDISTNSYAGSVKQDLLQTSKNRFAISFAAETAEEYRFPQEVFNPCGKINLAASESGDRHNREYVEHLKAMGEASTWLDASEMQRITGSEYYLSGLLTPKTATIQAAHIPVILRWGWLRKLIFSKIHL
jgi:glycine/D-amino acid oxidase-like deaminating enzyme